VTSLRLARTCLGICAALIALWLLQGLVVAVTAFQGVRLGTHVVPVPLLLPAAAAALLSWALVRRSGGSWPGGLLARRERVLARVSDLAGRTSRVPLPLLVVGVAAVVVTEWVVLQRAEPYLGHDESVYASKARSWLTTLPAAGWTIYRPPGLPALAVVALRVSDSVAGVRLVSLALALMTMLILVGVGSWLTTPRRAVVAAVAAVGGTTFVRRLPELLDDIGSAGLLLAMAACLVADRRGRRWGLPLAGCFAAATFYLRYGATSGVLAVALAAVVVWGPLSWWRSRARVALALALVVAALVPFAVFSTRMTGSPIGVLLAASSVAKAAYPGAGLAFYAGRAPFLLAGDLGGVLMAVGAVATVLAGWRAVRARRRGERPDDGQLARAFLGTAALLQVLLIGAVAHGEERFVLFAILTLTLLGVDALVTAAAGCGPVALAGLAVLALVATSATLRDVAGNDLRSVTGERVSLDQTVTAIAPVRPCAVVSGAVPELGWMTGCTSLSYLDVARSGLPQHRVVYVVGFRSWSAPSVARVQRLAGDRAVLRRQVVTTGSLGTADVVTVAP
jgi:hypothetical protein